MAARGAGAAARWAAVVVLIGVLVAAPFVVRALPVGDRDVSAADLRRAVLDSADVGFSGYAVSAGGFTFPVSDELPQVADLFSDRTSMRVWWRGPLQHRVDVITPAGETDVHCDPTGTWTWDYESVTATRGDGGRFALPGPADLLPTSLGRRLLSEATAGELSRIGAQRVAGVDALGVRIDPAEPSAAVDHVDVWVDPATGLAVAVDVAAAGGGVPALDTRFLDLEATRPPASVVEFAPPPGATVRPEPDVDDLIARADDRLGDVVLPDQLAGLPRRTAEGVPDAVGLYGRGVTMLVVVPVPRDLARSLAATLDSDPSAVVDDLGRRVATGPLSLMLVRSPERRAFLLTGTVTLDALVSAAGELPVQPR